MRWQRFSPSIFLKTQRLFASAAPLTSKQFGQALFGVQALCEKFHDFVAGVGLSVTDRGKSSMTRLRFRADLPMFPTENNVLKS
jgi:hypothetical protein